MSDETEIREIDRELLGRINTMCPDERDHLCEILRQGSVLDASRDKVEIPEGVDSYKCGALVNGWIEERRCLSLDGEDLYPGRYTVQVMVGEMLMETSFVRVVPGAVVAEPRAADLSEVVQCCAELGKMVRVEAKLPGERGKGKGESAGVDAPSCFYSFPSAQTRAENGCEDCNFNKECLDE